MREGEMVSERITALVLVVLSAALVHASGLLVTKTVTIINNIPTHVNTVSILDLENNYLTVKYQTCQPAELVLGTKTWGKIDTITDGKNIVGIKLIPQNTITTTMVLDANAVPTLTFSEVLYCANPKYYIYTLKNVTVTYTTNTLTTITITVPKVVYVTYQTFTPITAIDGSIYTVLGITTTTFTSAVKSYITSVITAGATRVYTVPLLVSTTTYNGWKLPIKKVFAPLTNTTVTFPLFDLQHSGTLTLRVSINGTQLLGEINNVPKTPVPLLLVPLAWIAVQTRRFILH